MGEQTVPPGFVPLRVAARRAGVSYRQADHWVRLGWVSGDHVTGANGGSGSRRGVSSAGVRALAACGAVTRIGAVGATEALVRAVWSQALEDVIEAVAFDDGVVMVLVSMVAIDAEMAGRGGPRMEALG